MGNLKKKLWSFVYKNNLKRYVISMHGKALPRIKKKHTRYPYFQFIYMGENTTVLR